MEKEGKYRRQYLKLYPVKTNGYTLYEIQIYLTFPWFVLFKSLFDF